MTLKVLILAGGSGTRLWPLSRKYYPKQFIQLSEFNSISFFQRAIDRASLVTSKDNIFVITNKDYKFHCLNQGGLREENIIIEEVAKNTTGAILLGIEDARDDDIFLVLSSDHIMKEEERFAETVRRSMNDARENIVTFGIKPTKPHTGYGYIAFEGKGEIPYKVEKFKEKPDLITAENYIKDGYYWNAGIFLFSKKIFIQELKKWNPEYFSHIHDGIRKNFHTLPDISVDYALLEKSDKIRIAPLDIYWNDLGGFEAFDEYFTENHIESDHIDIGGENNRVIKTTKKVVACIGVSDLIIVDTPDALVIGKKGRMQEVKGVIQELKQNGIYQADYGLTVYRPWGSYTIIDEGEGFKSKRLTVLPGKKLSAQLHYHRSEHWVVVSGTARILLDDAEIILTKGQSTYIPIGTKHRLENIGKVDLHVIESQIGDYLEEDDIVRFDDDFGRK